MFVASLLLILVAVTLLGSGLIAGSSDLLVGSIVTSLLAAVALVIGARRNAEGARGTPGRAPADPARGPQTRRSFDDPAFSPGPFGFDASDRRETVQFTGLAGTGHDAYEAVDSDAFDAVDRDSFAGHNAFAINDAFAAGGAAMPRDPAVPRDVAEPPDVAEAGDAGEPRDAAEPRDSGGHAPSADRLAGDFAEPDEDDPVDEPLPQSVRPADAVRIAQLEAEVLVVDGRPRYHLSECPHLVSRLTEPLPVREAVELGFNPCGLCRPVDRLVAASAER